MEIEWRVDQHKLYFVSVRESLRLKAEGACRCCESIVHIFEYEVKAVFRHITMNLSPQFGSLFTTIKEYR